MGDGDAMLNAMLAVSDAAGEVHPKPHTGSEEGSYLRLKDFCSLNSRLESNTEERDAGCVGRGRGGSP